MLTSFYLERYMQDKEALIKIMCGVEVPVQIMMETYKRLVKEGSLVPIEKMNPDCKQLLFQQYKNANVTTDKDRAIDICKVIHTLQFLSENV